MGETFIKAERLSGKILISKLFSEGTSIFVYPFRVTYLKYELSSFYPVQLLIAVPRSNIRNASDRNKIKRRIREAYRRNKYILYESLESRQEQLLLALTYTPKELLPYDLIRQKIIVLLLRLKDNHGKIAG